jgi:group I intron endonuclease
MFYVYLITNKINGKVYVGKTKCIKTRWQKHINSSNSDTGHFLFHKSIHKYGEQNFEISILETNDDEMICLDREKYWIEFYKSNVCKYGNSFGYNLTDGGDGASGHIHTDESKKKMSDASLGKLKSEQHKMALSKAHTGKILTEQHKENILKKITGKIRSNESKIKYHNSKLGIKNPMSKLDDNKVKEIKLLLQQSNMTCEQIANLYQVNRRTIQDIKLDKTWKHVVV